MKRWLATAFLASCISSWTLIAIAQCPAGVPIQGAPPPGPLPVFPADNWWNADISSAPVDASSASYIAFINNGGTRKLHPDFGGEESTGSVGIYGIPYVLVDGNSTPKHAVTFDYRDESDGVDFATGQGTPFYPLPAQAITQNHWVEGGAAASVDQRAQSDRHLLVVDCANRHLYELYNVWYDTAHGKWYAGSGALFDMNANARRPDGWTSADAAGLAIFPGLVRYDEVYNDTTTPIGHALRVTVRSTNGYVYPASHRAGSTSGALPMGARLRLRTSVNGQDPALRTTNAYVRKIFRAMQKHGLLVADNGSDLYITGTFDTRWDNGVLNPAFALLTASDFEVVQLGWKAVSTGAAALASIAAAPAIVTGGSTSTGTVTLSGGAPATAAVVQLASASGTVTVPASVAVAAGATSATFGITTSAVTTTTVTTLSATYGGVTRTAAFTVNPPPVTPPALESLAVAPTTVVGGTSATGTVVLTQPAPAGGVTVTLKSSSNQVAKVPPTIVVPAGATSQTFTVTTNGAGRNASSVTITASYGGVSRKASLTVARR